MRDIYLKRNELNHLSQKLRVAKFDSGISREKVTELINKQQEVYNRYKFYDNFLKIGGKINGEKIYTKER
jgi:hypothetical protein